MANAREAYDSHGGRKAMVRYEDLSPEQAKVVEEITRSILEDFYPDA
jgi:hypothetical protein